GVIVVASAQVARTIPPGALAYAASKRDQKNAPPLAKSLPARVSSSRHVDAISGTEPACMLGIARSGCDWYSAIASASSAVLHGATSVDRYVVIARTVAGSAPGETPRSDACATRRAIVADSSQPAFARAFTTLNPRARSTRERMSRASRSVAGSAP